MLPVALITGASGLLGRHVAQQLGVRGEHTVVGTGLHPAPSAVPGLDRYISCDLRRQGAAADLVNEVRPDLLFHFGGTFVGQPDEVGLLNHISTVSLIQAAALTCPGARFLLAGSAAEYGWSPGRPLREDDECRPQGPYAVSKHAATRAAIASHRAGELHTVVARIFNAVGPGISRNLVVGAMIERATVALAAGRTTISVGRLDAVRDFVAADDVAKACITMLATPGHGGQVFNICSGIGVPISAVVDTLLSFSPVPLELVVDPGLVRDSDIPSMIGDPGKAAAELGFTARKGLHDALRESWTGVPGGRG